MKIEFDTANIKWPKLSLKEYTDREVFFASLIFVFFGYMFSDWLDSRIMTTFNSRLDRVEVTLDKVVNQLNTDTIENDKESRRNTNQSHRFTRLNNTGQVIKLNSREFDCLSRNIYWESMREPLLGQVAVANVTYNRVKSGKWGNTFCQVVFAPKQFSWTNIKKIRNARPKNGKQWERARHSAFLFMNGVRVTNLEDSQFYYAQYIRKPVWASSMNKNAQIGQHIFYTASN